MLNIAWLGAFESGNIKLDDSLRPLLLELAQYAHSRHFLEILEIMKFQVSDAVPTEHSRTCPCI